MTERVIRIIIDSSQAKKGAKDIETALQGVEDQVEDTTADLKKMNRAGGGLKNVGQQATAVRDRFSSLKASAAAFVSVLVAGQVIRAADEYQTLQGQLRLVTDSTSELRETTLKLFDVAQETRQSLNATADLYIRLGRSTDFADERILQLTDTISKAVALSRATPQAAQAALFQLGQGFAAGALRGEELNSVLEQTPELAKAISDGLGITVGELRLLGAEGKLSAELVAEALENSADTVNAEFGDIPLTVGDALTRVSNSLGLFIGGVDDATGATGLLAQALDKVSQVITGLEIIVSGRSGFGARYDEYTEKIETAEQALLDLKETATGFESTSQSNFGGFRIVPEGERERAQDAIAAAVAEIERLRGLQQEILDNGGLTNAEKEAEDLKLFRDVVSDVIGDTSKLFEVSTTENKLLDATKAVNEQIVELQRRTAEGLIDPEEAARLENALRNALTGAGEREVDLFVRTFEGARIKAEEQMEQLNRYVADNVIDEDVADRIRARLEKALGGEDPQELANKFLEQFKTAADRAQEQIDQLDQYVEDELISPDTAAEIRDRLEKIIAKELVIPVKADVQALEDTAQRIDDLRGKIDAFNQGGEEGLAAFEAYIEARDIIAELGDEATVTVEELAKMIATEEALEEVLGDTTKTAKEQTDAFQDFLKQARANSQDILSGFLADPMADGLDELPLKFAKVLQELLAQALAAEIFKILGGIGGNPFLDAIGGFFGGAASGATGLQRGDYGVVGEQGPELFVAPGAGDIVPNDKAFGQQMAPQVNVAGPTIVNTIEDQSIIEAFNRGGGGETVLNYVTENSSSFRNALGIG